MFRDAGPPPPLSPVLLAGIALRPLPLAPLQPLLAHALKAVTDRHPGLFDRLGDRAGAVLLADPVDLPFAFRLSTDPDRPTLRAVETDDVESPADAVVRGPLTTLIDLLEGRLDGDAAFFGRDLAVEGDTAVVVALRNALDGADIDVTGAIAASLGPLGGAAGGLLRAGGRLFARASQDLDLLRGALVGGVERRAERQAAALRDLEGRVAAARPRRAGFGAKTRETPTP